MFFASMFDVTSLNGRWFVATGPVSPDPGRDEDPARSAGGPGEVPTGWRELPPSRADWLTEEEWVARVSSEEDEEWFGPGDDPEDVAFGDPAPPGGVVAPGGRSRSGRAGKGGVRAVRGYRRGPGQPGSARRVPVGSCGPAGAFAAGAPLDAAPGGGTLLGLAEYAAGDEDRFGGSTDDELTGIICALDRAEAAAAALKHAAVAELIRRRPDPAAEPALADRWEEFTGTELSWALAETRWAAEGMLDLACTLTTKLPGTYAAFRSGVLRQSKVEIIARAVAGLDPAEARAAEAKVLDRAGRLTPGGLRAAIRRAVIEVAPEKAAKRRQDAERAARVERWPEESGNAGLAGRELPPADVLAANQRISWWAKTLKQAGLDGDMDQLRGRAFIDLILGRDSRIGHPGAGTGAGNPGVPPTAGVLPAGFAGRINLTIPLSTLLHLAERPGELAGFGPVDPPLARDLAAAAAVNPQTTWCVTVTDTHGHATGHGCARPEPKNRTRPAGHDPPAGPSAGLHLRRRRAAPGRPAATAPGGWPPASPGSGRC